MTNIYLHLWPIIAYFVVPVIVARVFVRGQWFEIMQSYGVWIALLILFGFSQRLPHGEGYGWAMLMALFTTVFAIPIIVLLLKLRTYLKRHRKAGDNGD